MIRVFYIALILICSCKGDAQNILVMKAQSTAIAGATGTLRSLGTNTYTAFPHNAVFTDGWVASILKESGDHAGAGTMLYGTSDGSLNYNYAPVVINGNAISVANLGMGMGANNRVIINYQASDLGPIRFAYSDDRGQTWTASPSVFNYQTGYSSAQFGKVIKLGGGGLISFYYSMAMDGVSPSITGVLKSSDNGATWAVHGTPITRPKRGAESGNDALINGTGWTSEVYGVVTEMGGTDATTKVAVLLRDEQIGGGTFIHYRSSNGGATWTRVAGTGSLMDNLAGPLADNRYPPHIIEHNGLIYVFAGVRWNSEIGFKIAYVTTTSANFYNNTGYSAIQYLPVASNAMSNAASNDWGYPEPSSRIIPSRNIHEILIQWYDSTPQSSGSPRDMQVLQTTIQTGQ